MSIAGIIAVSLVALIILFQIKIFWTSMNMKGTKVEQSDFFHTQSPDSPFLLYFYSNRCPSCVAMTPIIDELALEFPNVKKINISESYEMAKSYNIMATPTTVLVKDGKIRKMVPGARNKKNLLSMLELE